MPTFKANFAEYDPRLSGEDNLRALFDRHNDLLQRLSRTINNLDEENFAIPLNNQSKGEDEDDGDE